MITGPWYLQTEYPMQTRCAYICWYMVDGSIVEFDLTDPRVPLPRFLSLVPSEPIPISRVINDQS